MADSLWKYFTKEKDGERAKCLKCPNKWLTSGLIRHLQHVHKINLLKRDSVDDQDGGPTNVEKLSTISKNQTHRLSFFTRKQSMAEIVARLAAVDGFSIHGICKSEFIRQALNDRHYILPKGKNNVMKLIHDFYKSAKCEVVAKIQSHKNVCGKFSLTLDEWTSLRNRRYLNINIHFNTKYINLGLVAIEGSFTSDKIVELVNSKLLDFGINLSDVVASTTDGAAVMVKFGRLSKYVHQLCYNHGIHLGVIDVIYKKEGNNIVNDDDQNDTSENQYSSICDEFSASDGDVGPNDPTTQKRERDDFSEALKMVRNIVNFFKRSPKRNSILQEHVKEKHGIELSLLLDCKTRWNSLVTMIERFIKIIDSVRKALNVLGSPTLLKENNIGILSDIYSALQPIKLAVEALGRRDANLVTADAILKFLFDSLRENNNNISNELMEVLIIRIRERRNQDLVTLIKYLQTLDVQSTADLPSSSMATIIRSSKEIFIRLFEKEDQCTDVDEDILSEEDSSEAQDFLVPDINERLNGVINAALKTKRRDERSTGNRTKNLKREFQIYGCTRNITKNLQDLLDALMTIQPTSVESERVFSASSNFCTKKKNFVKQLLA